MIMTRFVCRCLQQVLCATAVEGGGHSLRKYGKKSVGLVGYNTSSYSKHELCCERAG